MSLKFHAVEVSPRAGGKLITTVSAEKAGLTNLTTLRDFRRYIDEYRRREGHDYFWPNVSGSFASNPGSQPFPNDATSTVITSITRSGTTATVTISAGHQFVEGETVAFSGATQTEYNVSSAVISNVTKTTFQYQVSGSPATPATGSPRVKSAMPITLLHYARRPNGKTAVIAGTAARLFRFFALDSGGYYLAEDTYFEASGTNIPYFDDNPGEWIVIGNGYSLSANRWEAESINGWSTFNNGVDLPVTYRVEDMTVTPMYELRENGIAAVGTIWETNGILMAGDVSMIQDEKLDEIFAPIGFVDSGAVVASQSASVVTASSPIFASSDVDRWIIFDSGETGKILTFTDSRHVTVTTSQTVATQGFKFAVKASMQGSYFSGNKTATYVNSTKVVTVPSGTVAPVAGQTVRFVNGFSSVVLASPSPTATSFKLTDAMGEDITEPTPFWILDGASYNIVTAESDLFTADMVGKQLVWDNGEIRRIEEYIDEKNVRVDMDIAIASGFAGVENELAYARYSDSQFIDRIKYRTIWSMPDLPTRFAASVKGSIASGSRTLTLDHYAKSFETGQEVIITGAGVNGGNLTATILTIAANRVLTLDTTAITSVTSVDVQQLDSVGSIVGFYDLQDDSSGIIRGGTLSKNIVIYKETSIILGFYTGDAVNPFSFGPPIKINNGGALYYKNTLVDINSEFHVYAGENSFWRFDLTNQIPRVFESAELCKDIFFSIATISQTSSIFAVNNPLTKEVFFGLPSAGQDKVLAFDYQHGEWSTSSMSITAATACKRQIAGTSSSPTDNWFIIGNGAGVVMIYGLANESVAAWGAGVKSIYYRRGENGYNATKVSYDSVMQSGLGHFGTNLIEKKVRSYSLIMSSLSAGTTIAIDLRGTRNPAEAVSSLAGFPYSMVSPLTECGLHLDAQQNYFQGKITISGIDNPVSISGVIWEAAMVNANSNRRPSA